MKNNKHLFLQNNCTLLLIINPFIVGSTTWCHNTILFEGKSAQNLNKDKAARAESARYTASLQLGRRHKYTDLRQREVEGR